MKPERSRAALFAAALLTRFGAIDYRVRSRIIAEICSLKTYEQGHVVDALARALQAQGVGLRPLGRRLGPRAVDEAQRRADDWLGRGIFVITPQDIKAPSCHLHDVPLLLFAAGDSSLLDQPAAAVLNSRKPRLINPKDTWLQITKAMVESAVCRSFPLVSSYGTAGYSAVSELAKESGLLIACERVLPFMASAGEAQRFFDQYGSLFCSDRTLFLSPFPPGRVPGRAARMVRRDHLVAALASLIMVADVRSRGNVDSVLEVAVTRNIPVETRPLHGAGRSVQGNEAPVVVGTQPLKVREKVRDVRDLVRDSRYLIHYTRSCPGPWPGQTLSEYYSALMNESPDAGHTALDTLTRILAEGRIRSSQRLTRGPARVSCLTELLPAELSAPRMWRRGLMRWSFEPYGIALLKDRLFQLGARPVIYAVEGLFQDLSQELQHLFQPHGTEPNPWAMEKEWRIRGDLDLWSFDRDEMFVIVRRPEEANAIAGRFGVRVCVADAFDRPGLKKPRSAGLSTTSGPGGSTLQRRCAGTRL